MFASQIHCILTKDPETRKIFKGVVPSDKVPYFKKLENYCIVTNTASSETEGEHWTLYIKTDHCNISYIDSLAKDPKYYGICYKKMYEKLSKNLKVHKLKNPLQADSSSLCGMYCIFFAYYICRGTSINTIISTFFTRNRLQNDKKLCCWFKKFIKTAKPVNILLKIGQICQCHLEWKK